MISILGQIFLFIARMLPWIIRIAPFLLTIVSFLVAFVPAIQGWVSRLAGAALPAIVLEQADFTLLPTSYLARINTFLPLDTMATAMSLYIPYFIACLLFRIGKSWIPSKRT